MKSRPRQAGARLAGLGALSLVFMGGVALVLWWRGEIANDLDGTVLADEQADKDVEGTIEPPGITATRQDMVEEQLRGRDITDPKVLAVMGRVPRHQFVPVEAQEGAYEDHPLPIGHGQTISQPYIVALMTQLAGPKPESRALDIGTGSGYQAAVLAGLCKEVYSIEIVEALAEESRQRLERLGYKNVTVRKGDGYRGWPEKSPFDVIIVAAAPEHVPHPLIEQLAPGGRLVIPVGGFFQELLVIEKKTDGTIERKSVTPVRFVPMTGEAQRRQE